MTKTKEPVKEEIYDFSDLEVAMTVNALASSSSSINPVDSLNTKGTLSRDAKVICAPNVTDIPKFMVENANALYEILSKKNSVVTYKARLLALVHRSYKIENETDIPEFLELAFNKTDYKDRFIFSDVKCQAFITYVSHSICDGILVVEGLVKAENIKWNKACDYGTLMPSEIYSRVLQKDGVTFDCTRSDYWETPAWDGFPKSEILSFIRAMQEVPDIRMKVSADSIEFYAKKIDPEDFLNSAAHAIFPDPKAEYHGATVGQVFSAYFKLVKYKLPAEFEECMNEKGMRTIDHWGDGFLGINFGKQYYEDSLEDILAGELKDLKAIQKLLTAMIDAHKTGRKASGDFLVYCRDLFKAEIRSDPMKYIKGHYDGVYSDEIKAAAKCILGQIDDLYDDDDAEEEDD